MLNAIALALITLTAHAPRHTVRLPAITVAATVRCAGSRYAIKDPFDGRKVYFCEGGK